MKRFSAFLFAYLVTASIVNCKAEPGVGPAVAPASGWLNQPRMALLIGNGTYNAGPRNPGEAHFNNLSNPCNDVMAVEAKLVMLGWNTSDIVRKCDADTASIITELRTFVQKYQYSEKPLGIIYFAGHGLQVNDNNYLFGIDAAPNLANAAQLLARNPRATLFLKDSVDVNSFVYNSVGRITDGALLVILDACRDNPLLNIILNNHIAIRASAPRPIPSPPGIVTEFSTSNGDTAADGVGGNSPFAAALLKHLREDTRIDDILAEVGTQLTDDTNDKQIPQRTGYFVQRIGTIWCFYGCSASLDQVTRFGLNASKSIQIASLGIRNLLLDGSKSRFRRLADSAEVQGQGSGSSDATITRQDKDPGQKPNTQLIYARPVSSLPQSDVITPLNIDIFYCLGDGLTERLATSEKLASTVASIAFKYPVESFTAISQVRLRAVYPEPSSIPSPAINSNVLFFDGNDPGSKAFSSTIVSAFPIPLSLVAQREGTPGYMSIFICSNIEARRPPGQISFQIASRDEEPIARRSIESLKHALPDLSISDSLAFQPDKSPVDTEVHYYFEKDGEAARVLAQALSGTLNIPVIPKLMNRSVDLTDQLQAGLFEVWLGKSLSKNNPATDPKSSFWTTRDAVRDAGAIQPQFRQFKCGLPGLC